LQRAATAVAHAGPIKKGLAVVDQPARRREGLAGWAGVKVALLIERKILPTEGPVLAFRLVYYRDVRRNLLVVDEPIEVRSRAVGGIGRQALGFEIEALLGALIIVFAAPTSAWRMARDASTSMITPNFTSIR